jgi:tetratricopeptide (TPR) repeat protein
MPKGIAAGLGAASAAVLACSSLAAQQNQGHEGPPLSPDWTRCINQGPGFSSDTAIASCSAVIRLRPSFAEAYNNRGIAYYDKKDYDRAIADYNEAIGLSPSFAGAYANRGLAYSRKEDYDRAIADYDVAIRLSPTFALAYANRGIAYYGKKDYDRAIADYTKLIWLEPKNAHAFSYRGYIHFYKGTFKESAADLRRAVELDNDACAMLFRYLALARLGEPAVPELEANARRLTTKEWPFAAIELLAGKRSPEELPAAGNPDEICRAHFYIGQWHLLRGDKGSAAASLKTAADTCPKTFIEHGAAVAELERVSR